MSSLGLLPGTSLFRYPKASNSFHFVHDPFSAFQGHSEWEREALNNVFCFNFLQKLSEEASLAEPTRL